MLLKRNISILNLVILGTIRLSTTKRVLISLDDNYDRGLGTAPGIQTPYDNLVARKPEFSPHDFIQKLVGSISQQQTPPIETQNKCTRLFGSIYGAKNQRQKCLEKLKSKIRMPDNNLYPNENSPNYDEKIYRYPTGDLNNNLQKRFDFNAAYPFSSDYLDFKYFRSVPRPKVYWNYYRKSTPNAIRKRKMSTAISDLEKNRDFKRFQVIGNEKRGSFYSDDSDSVGGGKNYDPNDSDSSVEQKKRGKRPKFGIDIAESETSGETDIEFYIQGNKVLVANSNGGSRRRLPTFLPKRYHWEEDDIHNLGYYWFNGPQGRYPYYAVRP